MPQIVWDESNFIPQKYAMLKSCLKLTNQNVFDISNLQRYLLESLMATNVNKVIVFLLINNANMYASTLNTKEKLFMPKYLENMTKGFHISEIKWNLFKKLPIFTEKLQYLVNGLRFGFYYGLRFRSNRFKHSVKRFGRFGLDTLVDIMDIYFQA